MRCGRSPSEVLNRPRAKVTIHLGEAAWQRLEALADEVIPTDDFYSASETGFREFLTARRSPGSASPPLARSRCSLGARSCAACFARSIVSVDWAHDSRVL